MLLTCPASLYPSLWRRFGFPGAAMLLGLCTLAQAQQASTVAAPSGQQQVPQASEQPQIPPSVALATELPPSAASPNAQGGAITEEQIKQILVGKDLYLRNCYLDGSLSFNEHGGIAGHASPGSYTLCGIQIEKVKLSKHKVELLGARYGLHFLGTMPYEDPTKAVDRVRITPNKKQLRITIDREVVVKAKKIKIPKAKPAKAVQARPVAPALAVQLASAAMKDVEPPSGAPGDPTLIAPARSPGPANDSSAAETASTPQEKPEKEADDVPSEAEQLRISIAATPEAEKPADPNSVTTTTLPAHAAGVLREALDKIFAPSLDERMMASMPDFWKLYYQAVAARSDYRPKEANVLRQNAVDKRARLLTSFEPGSNEFAQAAGVAGMSLYHVVIGVDGKPSQIFPARPIGFGLDENAVTAIQNARFEPAIKDGKPVPVLLDLVVQFRIFSNRTAVTNAPPAANKPTAVGKDVAAAPASASASSASASTAPVLPGPYSQRQ